MNQSETSADENNFSAQENDVGYESDNNETDNESIDDLPVNADNNLAVNEAVNGEPGAIPSGSSGSLWLHYDTGECAICMGPHEGKSRLNCGHFFCFQCLVEWSRVKWQCPTCRQPFAGFVHQSAGSTQEQMYTPDGLPRLPTPVDTRDRSNMIRVLINGTWVWFGRVIHSILFSIFFIFITLFCFLKFFFVLPYDLLLYFLSFFFNFLDHTFDSLPVFLMNGTWVWFFMVIDFSIIFSIYFIFITLIYYYFFYFLLFFIFLYFFFFIYCLTIIMIT